MIVIRDQYEIEVTKELDGYRVTVFNHYNERFICDESGYETEDEALDAVRGYKND